MLYANNIWLAIVALVTITLTVLLVRRPQFCSVVTGRILAFITLFVLPLAITLFGFTTHLSFATSTEFCLGCHAMEDYGKSLYIDDPSYLPASHYQNNRIPRDHACYSCHTTYTFFGDVKSKIRGIQHLYHHYFGELPEQLALYEPYHNRECLHCHRGARTFEENPIHQEMRTELAADEMSCITCHDMIHNVAALQKLPVWHVAQSEIEK